MPAYEAPFVSPAFAAVTAGQEPSESQEVEAEGSLSSVVTGGCMMLFAAIIVVCELYAILISKLLPYTGISWLDAIKDDWHFCLIIPANVGASVFFIYWNWFALTVFRNCRNVSC